MSGGVQRWGPQGRVMLVATLVFAGVLSLLLGARQLKLERDQAEIVALSSRWVSAVAARDPAFVDLLGASAVEHYQRLRDVAFRGGVTELDALGPMDQLQTLFLRLTVDGDQLPEMSGREILVRAVDEHWIGQDLRRTDELREVVVEGNRATGRLYKFGQDDRPDRGRQYFVRESGGWRVDLRGERERLQMDFKAFVARSKLAPSEAAFFILETRLLRKVTPADFVPPAFGGGRAAEDVALSKRRPSRADLRVVAIRESPDDLSLAAVTIENRGESLRSVLSVGDVFGDAYGYRLMGVAGEEAWLERDGASIVLRLDVEGASLDERPHTERDPAATISLLAQARLGEHREGLMAQWRNVGLRGRPQLLQQAWLNPENTPGSDEITGLRVRSLVEGSFWHQVGLAAGDLLEAVNGDRIDSMDRWQELLHIAERDQEISVVVRRSGRVLRFKTRTVPPHGQGKAT